MAASSAKATKKRQVRDPETFRERALKASQQGDKPSKKHRIGKVLGPIGNAFKHVWNAPLLKPVRLVARLLGKVLVPAYFRNSWRELKQVTWLSFRQSLRLTWAVLLFAVVFGALVAIVDYGLDKVFRTILLK